MQQKLYRTKYSRTNCIKTSLEMSTIDTSSTLSILAMSVSSILMVARCFQSPHTNCLYKAAGTYWRLTNETLHSTRRSLFQSTIARNSSVRDARRETRRVRPSKCKSDVSRTTLTYRAGSEHMQKHRTPMLC